MRSAALKVMLACGGTGGHIFPAFSVAEELRIRDPRTQLVYVCGNKDIENAIFKILGREKTYSVTSAGFRGASSLLSPRFLLKLIKGFIFSFRILRAEKPGVVVGFGGHFSFPVVMAAKFLGIPTLIHEQNVVPGVANKFLARFVDGLALSFEDSRRYFGRHRDVRVTGNPIRPAIERASREEALKFFGFADQKTTLLVLGGSQGAESINTVFFEVLNELPAGIKENLQVLHLCGKMPESEAEARYAAAGVSARAYSFFDRMELAYAVADAALGRAGATFLAEAQTKNIPAVLVPYPFAGGHQQKNAEAFARGREAVIIPQAELTCAKLKGSLEKYLLPGTQRASGVFQQEKAPNARALLADFIEELAA